MATLSTMQRGWFWSALVIAIVVSCKGSTDQQGQDLPRAKITGQTLPDGGSSTAKTSASSQPQAAVCPPDAPVACASGCCPAGSSCSATGCTQPSSSADCPADSPVRCTTPVSCATGCSGFDASTQRNHASIAAPATLDANGRFGGGLNMQQPNCSAPVTAPTTGFPTGDNAITVEVWVKPSAQSSQSFFSYGAAASGQQRTLFWNGSALQWMFSPLGSGDSMCASPVASLADGHWHFIAATYASGTATLYEDGVSIASCPMGPAQTPSGTTLTIGSSQIQPPGYCPELQGELDELRVLGVAETAAQVQMDGQGPMTATADTALLLHFDEAYPSRCCPSGSSCGNDGACHAAMAPAVCPSDAPVDCGNGTCCPSGTTCGASGCEVSSVGTSACPADAPVECDGGACCPEGYTCNSAGACQQRIVASPLPAGECPPGQVAVLDMGGTRMFCCPAPSGSHANSLLVFTDASMLSNQSWVPTNNLPLCYYIADFTGVYDCMECASGYSCANSTICYAHAIEQTCPNGGTVCGQWMTSAGCCPSGTVCGAPTTCCPAGTQACGLAGTCCPSGQCDPAGSGDCIETTTSVVCPDPQVRCGDVCCAAGETCGAGNVCVQAAPETITCPTNQTACGEVCCPADSTCAMGAGCLSAVPQSAPCPADAPVQCPDSVTCCAQGFTCGASGECDDSGQLPMRGGPQGPECGSGWCDTGEVCASDVCCPSDYPVVCSGSCCLPGTTCTTNGCGCPAGEVACGDTCCGDGEICSDGACRSACADPNFPQVCGADACCTSGVACDNGLCGCPSDHPTKCGDSCCLSGADCSNGTCGCPSDRTACGDTCCASGETCSGGHCAAPVSCSGDEYAAKCPDGSQLCCSTNMVCCYDGANNGAIGCEFAGFCN